MSVCAVMLVRDEADVIRYTLEHLLAHVDHVIVADNRSTDGTREIAYDVGVEVVDDPEVAYYQSRKTTDLAMRALAQGHSWVIPCDADEVWYALDGRPLRDYLAGVPPDVQIVSALFWDHLPTAQDPVEEPNPLRRIGWRKREHHDARFGKVCARLRPDLVIEAGNHSARTSGTALRTGGLGIRHFTWRTPGQYVRKIRNGAEAYAASDLPPDIGAHWRAWEGTRDESIEMHFREWFFSERPELDDTLVYDPAPVSVRSG